MYPMDQNRRWDPLVRYDVGNRAKIFFWTIEMYRGGTLLPPAWLHSHRARHAGYLLLWGQHTPFRLLPDCGREWNQMVVNESANCDSLDAVRQRVLNLSSIRVLCHDDPQVPSHVELPEM